FSSSSRPPTLTLFPYTTLFRSVPGDRARAEREAVAFTQRLKGEGLVRDVAPADVFHPGFHELAERPALEAGDERDSLAARLFHLDRKSTRLNSSHDQISYAVFC